MSVDAAEAERVQRQLLAIANETRTSLTDTAGLYTKLALTLRETGVSSEALVAATRTVSQAVKLSGVEASAASAGLIQFAQAMGSGRLSGDELRSVLEQLPALAKAIADGLGVPIGQLRKLGEEGSLTTTKVLNALQKQAPLIAAQFRSIPLTIGDAFTKLGTSLTVLVGASDQATGASRDLARAISDLADIISSPQVVEGFQRFAALLVHEVTLGMQGAALAAQELQDVLTDFGLTGATLDQLNRQIGETNEEIAGLLTAQEQLRALGDLDPVQTFQLQGMERQIIALQDQRQALLNQRNALGESAKAHQELGNAIAPIITGTAELSNELQAGIDKLKNENASLTDAIKFYSQYDASLQDVTAALKAEDTIRALKISRLEAERLGIVDLLDAINEQEAGIERVKLARAEIAERGGIQRQIDALGQESEEYRVQVKLLEIKQNLGDVAVSKLEAEVRATEKLRSTLEATVAARDLDDTIAQQRLLLKFGGQETEAYRIQIRMLELKKQLNAEITPEMASQVRILEQQATQIEAAQESQELFTEAFKNAGAEIQRTMVDTFERILNGGVTTFSELASVIKDIFIRLAAELAVLMIIRPQVALSALGLAGAAGQASQFGAISQAGVPGSTSIFSDLSASINRLGTQIGFGGSVPVTAAGGTVPVVTTPGGPQLTTPATGFTGATLSQTLGAGAIGVIGGTIVGGAIGGAGGQVGGAIGGGVGAGAGFALGAAGSLGGPAGALIGFGIGSLLGGAIGGLFGGGDKENTGALRFSSLAGGAFAGPFGGFKIGGENSFRAPLTEILRRFDEGVAEFLTARQQEAAEAAVQALNEFDKRFPEADPSAGFAQILQQRAQTVIGAAFPDIKPGRIARAFEGAGSVEEIASRTQAILDTITRYNTLIGETTPEIEAARNQLANLKAGFAEVRESARALGLSVRDLNRAEREAITQLRTDVRQQVSDLLSGGEFTESARQFRQAVEDLRQRFAVARASAESLGIAIDGLKDAERSAVRELRQSAKQRINDAIEGASFTGSAQAFREELARINLQFDELRGLARELGLPTSQIKELNAAGREARQQLRVSGRQSIRELIASVDLGDAAGQLRSELSNLATTFDDARAFARELGFQIDIITQLNRAEATARRELVAQARTQLDSQALAASRQFDAILEPLREFQQELRFSVASPVEQFRLARQEFERIAALARGGDLSAIAALPQAGRLFLEQASAFGASPGRVAAETQIQTALSGVIQATTTAQQQAVAGLEAEIRRASDREIDTLQDLRRDVQETVRELIRLRAEINRARTA